MSTEHILVDGYSILHQWDELKPSRLRSLAAGRQALIHLLTRFHDCQGGELVVVFDGRSLPSDNKATSTGVRVLYSKEGQTADAVIERIVGLSSHPDSYLVATEDYAEQSVIESLGGRTISADGFYAMVKARLNDMDQAIDRISLKNRRFSRRG